MDDSGNSLRADNLVATVRGLLPSLTPAARTVARLILEDPATVAKSTITELSAASGTSEATIVRTARLLGFAGYPQLRLALATFWMTSDSGSSGARSPGTSRSGWAAAAARARRSCG